MIVDIFIVLLLISATALCVYLVITLKQLNESIKFMQNDIEKLVSKTLPVLENLNEVSEKALKVTNKLEGAFDSVQNRIENIKANIESFNPFGTVRNSFSLSDFISNLKAISKGVFTFIKEIKK